MAMSRKDIINKMSKICTVLTNDAAEYIDMLDEYVELYELLMKGE